MSTVVIVSGQRAVAVSPAAATTSVAQAVRPSAHNAPAGSQPRYRPGAGASRYAAVSATNARTLHAGSAGSVSGTSGTLDPQGSTRRSDAPGAACTLRRTPSPAGKPSVPTGMKLVVSIHTARPGGGWKRGAMWAVTTVRLESGPAVAASRNGATVSSGRGTQAIQPPSGSTGTDCPLMPRCTGPRAPRTAPNRNAESCDSSTSVGAG